MSLKSSRSICFAGLAACLVAGSVLGYGWLFNRDPEGNPTPPPEGETLKLSLPEEDREYLWQVEHHGNILSQVGFKKLAGVLSAGDPEKLTALLADSFRGRVPERTAEVKLEEDLVQVTRRTAVGDSFRTPGREDFAAELLSYRRTFSRPPRVKLKLIKFSPRRRGDFDGPWRGQCLLRMWGEWQKGKPAEVVLNLGFEVERPSKERFRQGGWVKALTLRQSLVGKAERFLLRDATAERGLNTFWLHDNWESSATRSHTGGVYLCDYNRDGRLDVLITELYHGFLYQGVEEGKFQDVTSRAGLRFRRREIIPPPTAWIDIDGDGWEDLIHGGTIWRNERGERFVDYSRRCNLRFPPRTTAAVVADYDRDGRLDLYVTCSTPGKADSWLSGKGGGEATNRLFRNRGGWRFEDVTGPSGAGGGNLSSFAAAWLDANADGWPDLYAINEFGDGVLLVNRGDGTFAGRRLADQPVDFGSMGVAAGDLDNDGHIDLYVASMYSKAGKRIFGNLRPDAYPPDVMARLHTFVKGNELYRNRGGLRFEGLGSELQVAAAGWAYGPALADLNNDGWLDIYSTAGFVSQSRDKPDG